VRRLAILLLALLALGGCIPKQTPLPEKTPEELEAERAFTELSEAFRQGDSARARVLAVQFLGEHPDHPAGAALRLRLARDYFREADHAQALHQLGRLDEDYPAAPQRRGGDLLRASILVREGRRLEAATLLDEGLSAWPASAPEREPAAEALVQLLEGGMADGELREFRRRRPESRERSRAGLALAEQLLRQQRDEEARPLLREVLGDARAPGLHARAEQLLSGLGAQLPDLADLAPASAREDLVGVLAPLSGRFSVYGEAFLEGARMALDRYNAERFTRFEMSVADTGGEPVGAALAARRLIAEEGASALLGEVLTGSTVAAAVEANAREVPLLSPSATAENIHTIGDWVFQNSISSEAQVLALARFAIYETLAARFAVLYPRQGNGQDLARAFAELVEELGGEMVASVAYEVGMTDFSEPLETIREAQPEVLFLPGEADQLVLIAPQLDYHDIYGQILGNEAWNSRRLARLGGRRVEGAVFPSDLLLRDDRERYEEFSRLYEAQHGSAVNPIAARSYLGMSTLLEVLGDGAGHREEIRRQLALRLADQGDPLMRRELLAGQVTFMTIREGRILPFGDTAFFDLED